MEEANVWPLLHRGQSPDCSYLMINGTDAADVVTIRSENPSNLNSRIKVVENGVTQYFARSAVSKGQVLFQGYGGDDTFDAYTFAALRVNANGGTGNDTLSGGALADILEGGMGADRLYGQEGSDYTRLG
jgi:Ca2+-binding RTX toxin-like protein